MGSLGHQGKNEGPVREMSCDETTGQAEHNATLTRRLLWKLDTRILPALALLLLCSFLDRTNVGNAKLYNFEKDLGMTDQQYDQGLAVFFATFIASELPSNLILKKATPRIWLPFLAFAWGVIAMCLGFIQNFAGFVALRALLGLAEGGLVPGIVCRGSICLSKR
jgi:MFS family permease